MEDIRYIDPAQSVRRVFSRLGLSLAAFTAISFGAQFLLGRVLARIAPSFPFLRQNGLTISVVLSFFCMYAVGFPVLLLMLRGTERITPVRASLSLEDGVSLFFISRSFLLLGSLISQNVIAMIERITGSTPQDTTSVLVEALPTPMILLFVVVLAPIFEEYIYRKLLIDRIGAYGDKVAILFSATVFGLAHGNFFQFFYTFLLGLILGYLYTQTGKLRYPIGLHMVTNFLGSIAVLPALETLDTLNTLTPETIAQDPFGTLALLRPMLSFLLLQYAFAAAGVVLLFHFWKKVVLKAREPRLLSRTQFARAALLNIGITLLMLLTIVEFFLSVFDLEGFFAA